MLHILEDQMRTGGSWYFHLADYKSKDMSVKTLPVPISEHAMAALTGLKGRRICLLFLSFYLL